MQARRPTIEDAIVLAADAHRGQRYPSPEAEPYVLHPLRLMVQFRDEVECMVAVLHDVVEDTTISLTHLLDAGYPAGVVAALDALTRREDEAYEAYIERVAHNHVATRIKLVDLAENLANNKWHPDDHATRSESVGTKRPLGTWAGNGRH